MTTNLNFAIKPKEIKFSTLDSEGKIIGIGYASESEPAFWYKYTGFNILDIMKNIALHLGYRVDSSSLVRYGLNIWSIKCSKDPFSKVIPFDFSNVKGYYETNSYELSIEFKAEVITPEKEIERMFWASFVDSNINARDNK